METRSQVRLAWISLFGLSTSIITFIGSPAAVAATVTATGTDPSICNQSVSDATNVTAVRLAGGDCVISFKSGTVTWSAPTNLKSARMLLIGGGGGGGSAYNNGGAGGGGAGQFIEVSKQNLTRGVSYLVSIGAGGSGGAEVVGGDNYGSGGGMTSISFTSQAGDFLLHKALGGVGGTGRNAINPLNSGIGMAGGAAATTTSGALGGNRGGGGSGGGGGGGSFGAGSNGSAGAATNGGNGGAGTASSITGSSLNYGSGGNGGKTLSTPAHALANTGNGGAGAAAGNGTQIAGANGGSGIVIIRYGTTLPIISALAIAGNSSTAVFRSSNSITATVNVPALVTFYAGRNKIAGCISLSTTGTSPNNVATCSWKPTIKGAAAITAEAAPIAGLAGSSSTFLPVSVIARSARR